MRVSDRMFYDLATKNSLDARERVLIASQEAATGQRVVSPGDDPSSAGLIVKAIEDVTPLPHNGCRPPKKRRV